MKTIKKIYTLTALTAMLMSGCHGDLMDLNPYGSMGTEKMWTSENLADLGVNGIYSAIRYGNIGSGAYWFDQYAVSTDNRAPNSLVKGNATTSAGEFSGYWREHYEGIHRANDAITNLPKAPLSDAKRGRLIAESKFLRAFFYYKLNMVFRGVPLYLVPIELSECTKGAETEAKIWEVVIQDLTDCINEKDLPNRYAAKESGFGRITKSAAYALRGKAYLWTKEWSKAEEDFKKVGELGHKLFTGGYKQLFKEVNEQCEEMIFSVQNIGLSGLGNDISFRYGSRSTFGSCWNNAYPNTDFVDSYEFATGEKFDWDKFFPGYNEMTPAARSVYFFRDELTEEEIKTLAGKGADMSKYLPVGNEARIRQVYETRDPRLMASIITPYSTYFGCAGITGYTYTLRYPFRQGGALAPFDLQTDSNTKYFYLYRKFVAEGPSEIPSRDYSPIDFPLIRYADVLLNLAEALNEQEGKTEEAIACVNLVRNRAGLALLNSNEFTKVNGQNDLRERIRNERRWEFNGEGVTFFDELRWGTWAEKKFIKNAGLKEIWGAMENSYTYGGEQYNVWPIPRSEREMNSNLKLKDNRWID